MFIKIFLFCFLIPFVCALEANSNINKFVVNPHKFKYILNPEHTLCNSSGNNVSLLVYVHSAPNHFKHRQALRDTWLRRSMFSKIRIVFMMGMPVENHIQELIRLEFDLFRDLVQENFCDTYKNLTYKGIMAMKWISEYCTQATYILKIDDDIIANPFLLISHVDHLMQHKIEKHRTIMCLVWTRMKVVRNNRSKWYVSKEDYEPNYFDPYCSGSAYLLTSDLPSLMYQLSFYVKFFWVDDFYITGLLARATNATHEFLNSLYALSASRLSNWLLNQRGDLFLFGHLSKSAPNTIYMYWKLILKRELANSHLKINNHTPYEHYKFIDDFKWTMNFWDYYFSFNEDYFY